MDTITTQPFSVNLAGQHNKWFAYHAGRYGECGAVWTDDKARPLMFCSLDVATAYVERRGAIVLQVTEVALSA
jgi:hypothetical protein